MSAPSKPLSHRERLLRQGMKSFYEYGFNGTTVDAMERELILQTLNATGNNKTRAADLLGISLKTLHNKLKEYGGANADAE